MVKWHDISVSIALLNKEKSMVKWPLISVPRMQRYSRQNGSPVTAIIIHLDTTCSKLLLYISMWCSKGIRGISKGSYDAERHARLLYFFFPVWFSCFSFGKTSVEKLFSFPNNFTPNSVLIGGKINRKNLIAI